MHLTAQQPQHKQHERVHAPRPTELGVRWSDERDEGAPGLQNLEGFLQRFARNSAQNGIVVPQHLFKFLLLVVNHHIASQASHQFRVPGAGRCRTLAPRCFASWIANVAMPPAPAGMNTLWPGLRCARSFSACHAVSPTIGMEAACTKSRFARLSAAAFSGTSANSARAPLPWSKMLAKTA